MSITKVICLFAVWLACVPVWAQGTAIDTTHTLTVTTGANGKVQVVQSAVTLTESASRFGSFSGAVTLQFYARTLSGGQITLQATSDFGTCANPASAPSIACNLVQYTCGGSSFGTPCSTSTTLSTTAATTVITLPANSACTNGGSPCGTANPFSIPLSFTLTNDPYFRTGPYSAALRFTISAN